MFQKNLKLSLYEIFFSKVFIAYKALNLRKRLVEMYAPICD